MQSGDSAHKLPSHEEVVRFSLCDVTETAELLELREKLQPLFDIRKAEIDPAYNSNDAFVALRQIQKEMRLLLGLIHLHRDRAFDAVRIALALQLFRHEIAFQWRHRVPDPCVARGVIPPEVLVRINGHS